MKYEEITKKIIAASMKVHSELWNGFQEVFYQRALEIEMSFENLSFQREMEIGLLMNFGLKSLEFKKSAQQINQVIQ